MEMNVRLQVEHCVTEMLPEKRKMPRCSRGVI